MALSTTINYIDGNDFTFDSNEIEFPGSLAQLKDMTPINSIFGATFTTNENGNFGGGVLTGTLGSGAVVTGGQLDTTGGGYCEWAGASNFQTGGGVGTFKFKLTPDYTGSPSSEGYIFNSGVSSANNRISLRHSAAGAIIVNIKNSTGGNLIVNITVGSWSPTAGITYELLFAWDVVTGATRLFIDGVQLGSTITTTGTMTSSVDIFRLGARETGTNSYDGKFEDLVSFSDVQETGNYTPGYILAEDRYSTLDPTIIVKSGIKTDSLSAFSAIISEPSGSAVKFHLDINGQAKYWDGASWINSDSSLSQSNTATEINTNAAALSIGTGITLKVVAVLNSDGSTLPSITSATITYSFWQSAIAIAVCTVWGYIYDNALAVNGATVRFISEKLYNYQENFISINESVTSNSIGYFEVDLPRTVLPDPDVSVDVIISFTDGLSSIRTRRLKIVVPDSDSSSLEDAIA